MAFQVSAGVNFSEIDLTTVVPATSTTEGAFAGVFRWGPLDKIVLVDSENTLVNRFGKPTNFNPETWFTAANFLSYGNKLYLVRAANVSDETGNNGVLSAVTNTANVTSKLLHVVKNEDDYEVKQSSFESAVQYIARYPGELGNSIKISVCETANQYGSNTDLKAISNGVANTTDTKISFAVGSNVAIVSIANAATFDDSDTKVLADYLVTSTTIGDLVTVGNTQIGFTKLKISSVGSVLVENTAGTNTGVSSYTVSFTQPYNLIENVTSTTISRNWEYYNNVDLAPGQSDYVAAFGNTAAQDEIHVVVTDEGGKFTGVPGTILEVYSSLSRATDAKTENGSTNYYKTVLNNNSRYVWFANDRAGAVSNTAANVLTSSNLLPYTERFGLGSDGANEDNASLSTIVTAFDKFASGEVAVSLVMQGKAKGGTNGEALANYIIDNIVESRRDCVAFISPDKADVVNNAGQDEAADIVTFRNSLRSTSYAILDSGYKWQYDKYNDTYRFIPLNGDIAGLCVRTDETRDPWFSPAGFNRGQIKNIIKLAYNPSSKGDRDLLYKNGVNPVVTFPGRGTVLYGDKTLLSKPSAFDRINVRRLFIVLEKSIAIASEYSLFEFNDDFTRSQFKNLVEPFLRDVLGRRGIYDFKVICDGTNNTGEVIDRNEFVGDIYIKPARSINFIQLNFVAVRSGVDFNEIVGQF